MQTRIFWIVAAQVKYQIDKEEIRKEDQNKSAWCLLFAMWVFLSKSGTWREALPDGRMIFPVFIIAYSHAGF